MSIVKVGDSIPEKTTFRYVKIAPHDSNSLACPVPTILNLSKEAESGETIVIVSFPGAFTPTCSQEHVPEFIDNAKKLLEKGVKKLIFLSANDAFVLQAFAKANKVQDDPTLVEHLVFASDADAAFSKKLGLSEDLTKAGLGIRTGRYALVIKDNKFSYVGHETGPGVTVSGYKSVYEHL